MPDLVPVASDDVESHENCISRPCSIYAPPNPPDTPVKGELVTTTPACVGVNILVLDLQADQAGFGGKQLRVQIA